MSFCQRRPVRRVKRHHFLPRSIPSADVLQALLLEAVPRLQGERLSVRGSGFLHGLSDDGICGSWIGKSGFIQL